MSKLLIMLMLLLMVPGIALGYQPRPYAKNTRPTVFDSDRGCRMIIEPACYLDKGIMGGWKMDIDDFINKLANKMNTKYYAPMPVRLTCHEVSTEEMARNRQQGKYEETNNGAALESLEVENRRLKLQLENKKLREQLK